MGYSVTTCDEPLHAELGFKTWNNRRDFYELKWYCKVMCMNDKRLPFNLLSNQWNKVKCMGHPRISWVAQVDILGKKWIWRSGLIA